MGSSTTAKVGFMALIGLAAIAIVIGWKTEIFMVSRGYELKATFQNIEGLTIGSEVRYRGLKVGKVLRIDPGPYDIKVFTVIDGNIKVTSDSALRVAYDGIVGLKFLEIKPGTSEVLYSANQELKGERTSAIVDFVDLGSQNLVETKAILETVRKILENPALQAAIFRTGEDVEKLTRELSETTAGINRVASDPKFQENLKGTIQGTNQTLSSANRFFDSMGKLNLRTTGGIDLGTRANAVRGNVDIIQDENKYYRFGVGEGPTRTLSVLDFLFTNRINKDMGYRLGIINSQLGGGLIYNVSPKGIFVSDIYDINNLRPNWPKVRLGYEYELRDYLDLMLQADDILNGNNSNLMIGVRVKSPGEKGF